LVSPQNTVILLYPNPNHGKAELMYELLDNTDATLSIYDALGREVYTTTLDANQHKHSIELPQAVPGVYLYNIKQGDFMIKQEKFVVH
jgi:hypothetical protein